MPRTLIFMAAGIGRRYGGLKQLDAVGPSGETLLDYSRYDAARAGFDRFLFVIRPEIERPFRDTVLARFRRTAPAECVYQRLEDLPAGFRTPAGRGKPWGTGQALLACREHVREPFAVINADDFYGRASFAALAGFLGNVPPHVCRYGMVGFALRDTLSDHGPVSRGVCETGPGGLLTAIAERHDIRAAGPGPGDGGPPLSGAEPVSMNMWGFTPAVFRRLESLFAEFLRTTPDPVNDEFYLPTAVNRMIAAGEAVVSVLPGGGPWFGMTNRADRDRVAAGIRRLVAEGLYPARLY